MSNQAGQSNLRERLEAAGLTVAKGDPALALILDTIKTREAEGYSYDTLRPVLSCSHAVRWVRCPTFLR